MAFKPNREKLNANFEGYKLSNDPLPCVSEPLPCNVNVARLKEEQFSYQHVRSFSLHNHLVLDPWDQNSAYWYAEDRTIQKAKFEASSGSVSISSVYRCEPHPSKPSGDYVVNASIVFLTDTLCLFSDGDGSLQLLQTENRIASAITSPAPSLLRQWKLLENISLTGLEGAPFMVLAARVSLADGRQLNTATLELKDPSSFKRSTKNAPPTVTIYRWHRLRFTADLASYVPQLENADIAPKSLLVESRLCCTLQSHAISLYCDFLQSNLLIVSESDVVHHEDNSQDPSAQEPACEEIMELDEAEKPHLGLGYAQTETKLAYEWSQSDTDVTITVTLPPDATKQDVSCAFGREDIVVGLTDGTTYVRGKLYAAIDPEASAWTIEKGGLEVTLGKKEPGTTWPSLLEGVEEENGGVRRLPLTEGLTSGELHREEMETIERKIVEASKRERPGDESEAPRNKKPRPMVENTLEECDAIEEDASFFVFGEDGAVTQRAGLGGRHVLFTASGSLSSSDILCLRHDVDAIIWQPSAQSQPPSSTADDPTTIKWVHGETFNALGYVQSAKEDKKFTTCPSNFAFTAISDCNRHVFVYRQPPEGVKGNEAAQYVHTVPSGAGILGLQASDTGLVFVLSEKEMLVLSVK